MLKKITIEQLALGMHVHAVCGSWFDNPFWSNSFTIESLLDLAKLQGGRVRQVWIDTSKGADVTAPLPVPLAAPAPTASSPPAAHEAPPAPARPERPTSGTADELARAARIIAQSRRALTTMFGDIRMGRLIDVGQATPLVDDISASVLRLSLIHISEPTRPY